MVPPNIAAAVASALRPEHFFVFPPAVLRLEFTASETVPWEFFRGHLLDASRTRERRTFAAWQVFLDERESSAVESSDRAADPPAAPRVSIRWDEAERKLYVVRNILTQSWEAYEPRPGFIESRPVRRWTPELIATLSTDPAACVVRSAEQQPDLSEELAACMELAWTGVSRLPITSVEAPLPDFALGRMAYFAAADAGHLLVEAASPRPTTPPPDAAGEQEQVRRLLVRALAGAGCEGGGASAARRLEVALRAADAAQLRAWLSPDGAVAAERSARRDSRNTPGLATLVQSVFHHISLTPYTRFADNLLVLLETFAQPDWLGPDIALDLIGHMIRHLVRHLTAYDLVRFHSFGANYPDAIWLDGLLRLWLAIAERHPALALSSSADRDESRDVKRRRRRALRQGWLLRKSYEGHPVPDHPTSRGENVRVIPGHNRRVPEEQITQTSARRKRLYDADPTDALVDEPVLARMLAESLVDLQHPLEARELGMATFLDRPFGIFKAAGEVDRTPMLAYEAYSREIARHRFEQVVVELPRTRFFEATGDRRLDIEECLDRYVPVGMPASDLPGESRPGIIMLEDARVAASDFLFTRTVRGSYELLAATPLGLTAAQAATVRSWSATECKSLFIRTANVDAARSGTPWITRWERRGGRLEPVDRIALAAGARPTYAEAFGIEFLANGIEIGST